MPMPTNPACSIAVSSASSTKAGLSSTLCSRAGSRAAASAAQMSIACSSGELKTLSTISMSRSPAAASARTASTTCAGGQSRYSWPSTMLYVQYTHSNGQPRFVWSGAVAQRAR